MRTFASTDDSDFALGADGNLTLEFGKQSVATVSRQYMLARRGEMRLAVDRGVPYAALVWAGEPNVAQFEAAARQRILQVPAALEIESFNAEQSGDTLGYIATIRTTEGETTLNGNV